ncbi:MAG TPA: glycosyltransferase family 39 protein [Clostridia bacterium]|nr:glycosyltransferase family 39 protein [Clostridia bacterium]
MKKIALIVVILSALFLRVYKLAEFPTGLNADEAAIGYNAYSLLQTGKDEFGHSWPINFQSFNDWKPGLYFYLVLPWVKILGLNEWAVRLPSAVLGVLTVLVGYFLVKELAELGEKTAGWAWLTALLLAISPWHLHFSRGGWETNAATFFMALGVFLFLRAIKRPHFFLFSVVSFLAAMFAYHSARLVVPLLVLGLGLMNRKKIFVRENRVWLGVTFVAGGLIFGLLLFSMTGQAGTSRFAGVGLLADQGPLWRVNELRGEHSQPAALFPTLVHNRYFEYGRQFLDNYLRHFSSFFLFTEGDEIQRNRVPGMGQMYLIEAPLLILGLYFLLKCRPKNWQILFWWLAVAPVASALTFQSPHAIRALNLVVPLTMVTAYGIDNLKKRMEKSRLSLIVTVALVILAYLGNFAFYLYQYYVRYPQLYPAAWEDGFKQLGNYLVENQENFGKIYITNRYDQPYILLAFYLKYPPAEFQREAKLSLRDQYGFSTVEHFDKFYFGPIDWSHLQKATGIMIVGTTEEVPDSAKIAKRIYFKDGQKEVFRIVEN